MLHPVWAVLGVVGAVVVVTGWLPGHEAREVALVRGGPVLGFLVAITVLSELAERAGVFDAAAGACARLARGSTIRLHALVALLGTLVTVGMSLDTTAVLLTPVVLTITDRLGLRPLPFALLVVWLANTASLLLPVSNLTNLLALQREHLSAAALAGRMALPELVAVVLTTAYLALLFRQDLRGRYQVPGRAAPADAWTFRVCALACLALAPGVLAGAPPWAVGTACAAAAVAVFAVRRRSDLHWAVVPWRIVVLTEGLFLTVAALASNAVNNLPAHLALEPAVPRGHVDQLLGALLGTNAGPLVLLWGSLATLLWRERCRARGVTIGAGRFAAIGLGGVPLVLLGTSLALHATG